MKTRIAQLEDAERIARLVNTAFRPERFFIDADRTNPDKVRALLEKGKFLLAENDGALVGCVYVELRGERGYFGLLAIDPALQRSGLGSRLVAAAEEECRSAGCRVMDLTIVNLRSELPAFYNRLGYNRKWNSAFSSGAASKPALPSGENVETSRVARVARTLLSACRQRQRSQSSVASARDALPWTAMVANSNSGPSLVDTIHHWWKKNSAREGFLSTLKRFLATLWEFVRESTPSRRRQRYGDVEYDWDYRVDTTGATVSWRDRLLGMFHSAYQPTEPVVFREMLASLKIDFREFTFIDIGSGKGRVLLMASDYPFRHILGIELLPQLHRVAKENIAKYKSDSQQCFAMDCLLGDACEFAFPPEPTVLYLFNPLPESGLLSMIENLEQSLREYPRPVFVLYHNPLLEQVLTRSAAFQKISGTNQYSLFAWKNTAS